MSVAESKSILDPVLYDLGTLEPAEEFWLWRLRQRAGNGRLLGRVGASLSRAQAAERLGISVRAYAKLERGRAARLTAVDARALAALGPLRPTPGELCLIARRRAGAPLARVAGDLEISRPHYHAQERAAAPAVVSYWEGRGFRFPRRREDSCLL
jgi:transcriptional regulator with XRE-family HTH domain